MNFPLVSVIIPNYNHGKYLGRAIESILVQSYANYEIVVVDDGSEDDSKQVAEKFDKVRYFFQPNAGLSAARNAGITHSKGEFLVFLDADDWLAPDALRINVEQFRLHENAVFVSGAHITVTDSGVCNTVSSAVQEDHYRHFLEGNYISMIATVMWRRWLFNTYRFDTSLRACEDYELYLKISRDYPVAHHQEVIAYYFFHDANMSNNGRLMISSVLTVLERQKNNLRSAREEEALKKGIVYYKKYYSTEMYVQLLQRSPKALLKSREEFSALLKHNPSLFVKFFSNKFYRLAKKAIKRIAGKNSGRLPGTVNLGHLNRVTPFSTQFGYDRGGPVDRYYIENFLEQHASLIKGRILEIGDNEYTLRYGGNKITQSDILHVDSSNPRATYVGDLCNLPQVASDSYDCIILTQTLHLIFEWSKALETCYRILKPGGVLLLTVPGISHIDQGEWNKNWLWSFTRASVERMLAGSFLPANIKIQTYGNVLAATAFLFGMGLPEVEKNKLDVVDPHYQVIIVASAFK